MKSMSLVIPHPIPYQGSKRRIAARILTYFPEGLETLIEPFAGSAAVSLAAACGRKAERFHLSDSNTALMALWREIIERPESIARVYEALWNAQSGNEKRYYQEVRAAFNREARAEYLLYL